ncbi:MAG: hypothetical protein WC348_01880 [Patescibacteria group bacterium]|jgi:hypothetical protein
MTKKFWMMVVAIMALGMTGCPDGDDCPVNLCDECGNGFCGRDEALSGSCPDDCGGNFCGDGYCDEMGYEDCSTCAVDCGSCVDGGADADADSDSDTTEDDGDTACLACPDVTGDWALTYHRNSDGVDYTKSVHLDQDGILVTGYDEDCEYSGTISESGYISLFRDCPGIDRTVTGNFTATPTHMGGDWYALDASDSGTWFANPQ